MLSHVIANQFGFFLQLPFNFNILLYILQYALTITVWFSFSHLMADLQTITSRNHRNQLANGAQIRFHYLTCDFQPVISGRVYKDFNQCPTIATDTGVAKRDFLLDGTIVHGMSSYLPSPVHCPIQSPQSSICIYPRTWDKKQLCVFWNTN